MNRLLSRVAAWKRHALLVATLFLTACATPFEPTDIDDVGFLQRAETQEKAGIRVTVAVPSARETRELFGVSLYSRRVQPVWLRIENETDVDYSYLPVGTDTNYFSPIEAASVFTGKRSGASVEQFFFQTELKFLIGAGDVREGFIFTNLDEGTKALNVDLVSMGDIRQFTFFVPVPGLKLDHHDVDFDALYTDEEIASYDDADSFIEAVRELPCCTTDAKAAGSGDPLNLVIIGEPFALYYAFLRSGWDETEAISASSGFKTAVSFLTGGEYRYSPVSNLYVFGRSQDAAFQKIRKNIHERNHLRVWLAPLKFKGQSVWIGQISRDIGVRFTRKTITTHKIDPDVDETREFLLENLAYNQSLARIAYVPGVGAAPLEQPRGNLTGDPYFTDGLRVVLWVSSVPVDTGDIEVLSWIARQ